MVILPSTRPNLHSNPRTRHMARTRQKVTGAIIVICNLPVVLSVMASPCRQKELLVHRHHPTNTQLPMKKCHEPMTLFLRVGRGQENLSLRLRPVERFSPPVWFIHLIQLERTHQVHGHIKKQDVQSKPRILLRVYLFFWGNTTIYLKKLAPSCFDVDMQLFRAGC